MAAVVQGGDSGDVIDCFSFSFFFFSSGTFSGTQREVSHEPQASAGQGEKDQQASEGNLE